jgi:phage shock protein E
MMVNKPEEKLSMLKKAVFIALLFSFAVMADATNITPQEVLINRMTVEPYTIIDVRSVEEFSEGHIKGAVNIPFNQWDKFEQQLNELKGKTVVVYCRSGRRAGLFMEATKDLGIQYLHLDGDFQGWAENNLPIVQPR